MRDPTALRLIDFINLLDFEGGEGKPLRQEALHGSSAPVRAAGEHRTHLQYCAARMRPIDGGALPKARGLIDLELRVLP